MDGRVRKFYFIWQAFFKYGVPIQTTGNGKNFFQMTAGTALSSSLRLSSGRLRHCR